jgi:hypothetical protein
MSSCRQKQRQKDRKKRTEIAPPTQRSKILKLGGLICGAVLLARKIFLGEPDDEP